MAINHTTELVKLGRGGYSNTLILDEPNYPDLVTIQRPEPPDLPGLNADQPKSIGGGTIHSTPKTMECNTKTIPVLESLFDDTAKL